MSTGSRKRCGFSFIEALVAVTIFAIGVAGIAGALSSLTFTETVSRKREDLQLLVMDKYNEMVSTGDFRVAADGNFAEKYREDVRWESDLQATGTENLWRFRVTATDADGSQATAAGVLFDPPEEVDGTTGGTQ